MKTPAEALHALQHLVDLGDLVVALGQAAAAQEAVGLVEQQHGAFGGGFFEHAGHVLLGLADELAGDVAGLAHHQRPAQRLRDVLGQRRLAGAGRAVETQRAADGAAALQRRRRCAAPRSALASTLRSSRTGFVVRSDESQPAPPRARAFGRRCRAPGRRWRAGARSAPRRPARSSGAARRSAPRAAPAAQSAPRCGSAPASAHGVRPACAAKPSLTGGAGQRALHQAFTRARRRAQQQQVVLEAAAERGVDLLDAVGDPDHRHRVGLQDLVDPGLAADAAARRRRRRRCPAARCSCAASLLMGGNTSSTSSNSSATPGLPFRKTWLICRLR